MGESTQQEMAHLSVICPRVLAKKVRLLAKSAQYITEGECIKDLVETVLCIAKYKPGFFPVRVYPCQRSPLHWVRIDALVPAALKQVVTEEARRLHKAPTELLVWALESALELRAKFPYSGQGKARKEDILSKLGMSKYCS